MGVHVNVCEGGRSSEVRGAVRGFRNGGSWIGGDGSDLQWPRRSSLFDTNDITQLYLGMLFNMIIDPGLAGVVAPGQHFRWRQFSVLGGGINYHVKGPLSSQLFYSRFDVGLCVFE